MAFSPVDQLRRDVSAGQLAIIVGAGAAASLSGSAATATWGGLIRSGAERATALGQAALGKSALVDLEQGLTTGQVTFLTAAADKVVQGLGGGASAEFKRWLRSDVGDLTVVDNALAVALQTLEAPILTTNYDGLLEASLGRQAASWDEPSRIQEIITGRSSDIGHLHGYWQRPSSVVFTATSYGTLLGSAGALAIEHALVSLKSLLFVGFGTGLSDPNFTALFSWLDTVIPGATLPRYIICREQDVDTFSGSDYYAISFGSGFEQLPKFLRSLAPADASLELPANSASQVGVTALSQRIRETSALDTLVDERDFAIHQLLVEPVLLPASSSQLKAAAENIKPRTRQRLEPSEVASRKLTIVVGGPDSGLTSALQWLASKAAMLQDNLVPVYLDYQEVVTTGRTPLERKLRRELMASGVLRKPDDKLPGLAVAIDNFEVGSAGDKGQRIINDMLKLGFEQLFVGCRTGAEGAVAGVFDAEVTFAHLGRIAIRDATRLAALVDPVRAEALARRAMNVIQTEMLIRSPRTVILIISTLNSGENQLLTGVSTTGLLNAYLFRILGRDDPRDDARFGLDSANRADLLTSLASKFMSERTGSLTEAEIVSHFQGYFNSVDWDSNPVEVLTFFRLRGILTSQRGRVRFSQATYLHLFAARHGLENQSTRKTLLDNPLYMGPILRHYAALAKSDTEVMTKAGELVQSLLPNIPVSEFGPFGKEARTTLELPLPLLRDPYDPSAPSDLHEDDDFLDLLDDPPSEPFPLDDVDEQDMGYKYRALAMGSNILRDSELVADASEKQRVLGVVAAAWGRFAEALAQDPAFAEVTQHAEGLFATDGEDEKDLVSFVIETSPLIMIWMSLGVHLSTTKLARALGRCLSDALLLGDPVTALSLCLYAQASDHPDWQVLWREVSDVHDGVFAFSQFLPFVARLVYEENPTESHLDLVLDLVSRQQSVPKSELGKWKSQARQAIATANLRRGTQRKLMQDQTLDEDL